MINAVVGKANPVGVVQGGHSLERAAEFHRILKVQGMGLDLRGLRRTFGMPREGSHTAAGAQQSAGNGLAGIAEGSGDGIGAGVVAAGLWSEFRRYPDPRYRGRWASWSLLGRWPVGWCLWP